jgi:uncharacterized membrane protein YjfL (UPF0719 family)
MTGLALEFGTVDGGALVDGLVATVLYFAVGAVVLAVGFLVLDLLTPGNLRQQVYIDKNPNAALLLAGNHVALAVIVVTSILTSGSEQSLAQGLVDSGVYGALGVVLQAVALRVLDAVVPADLRGLVREPRLCGAAWAVAATLVAVGAVNAAALS